MSVKIFNYIKFSKGHHLGIVILIVLIIFAQGLLFYFKNINQQSGISISKEEIAWLQTQKQIDSLKIVQLEEQGKIYPFNPNFISDYKGYKYGLTLSQIDKLHKFRAQNKYVNSPEEFQKLTGVSNDWMKKYAPFFKFPDWVTQNKKNNLYKNYQSNPSFVEKKIVVKDINLATKEDLESVYMIGERMAQKILDEKEKFGAFVSIEQIGFIWGISPDAITDLNKKFYVKSNVGLKKIKINDCTIKELAQFPYFNYTIAKNIVTYRSMNDGIKNFEDLTKIKQFPVEKLKIIALYLEF